MWETEFSIPQEQAEKRSGCLKPGNGFLSVGRAAETFPLRHQQRRFHVLIRPAHPGIFLSYAEARLSRRRAQKSKASVLSRTPCWIGRDQQPGMPGGFLFLQALVNRHAQATVAPTMGLLPIPISPSFPRGRVRRRSRQTGRRHAYGPWSRSSRKRRGRRPYCRDAGCGRCRRRKRRRSTFCRFPEPISYRCRLPDAGTGWGWWSCR